jgi:hypothetical protein
MDSNAYDIISKNLLAAYISIFLGAFAKLQKVNISFVMSIHLSVRNNPASNGWVLMKLDISAFLRKSAWEIKVSSKSGKNNGCFT